jgi:hypothetical protein
MSPDERALRAHLEGARFRSGVARGQWGPVGEIVWPRVLVTVTAAAREQMPEAYTFRFDCANYPVDPPTAAPWDTERGTLLDPGGWPAGTGRVGTAFGRNDFVYLPCDRGALAHHPDWVGLHPHLLWTRDPDITFYLEQLHDLLNSPQYRGRRNG